ncbi:hypothetical protein ACLB1G_10380 [Oxalobacteraceae bacterium A2-2]
MNVRAMNLYPLRVRPSKLSPQKLKEEQHAYAVLYGLLMRAPLGLDPSSFQLLSQPVPWDWHTDAGRMDSAQYNFCAAIPSWSAVAEYHSTAPAYDHAYAQFLCVLAAEAGGARQAALEAAQVTLLSDASMVECTIAEAHSAYLSGPARLPFMAWLNTETGSVYRTQIANELGWMAGDLGDYRRLLDACDSPLLAAAVGAYADERHRVPLSEAGAAFPAVPAWHTSADSRAWADRHAAGMAAPLRYRQQGQAQHWVYTWAGQADDVDHPCFAIHLHGEWQRLDEFYADLQLSVTVESAALEHIAITPERWFSGVAPLADGPYLSGFSRSAGQGGNHVLGQGGLLPLMKTGMLAVLNPRVRVAVSAETYAAHRPKWAAATGFRIGPFVFGGPGRERHIDWDEQRSVAAFSLSGPFGAPQIVGVTIATQPAA